MVRPVVTNSVVPPCLTFTEIVVPVYHGTGISILTGSLKWSPILEIPNSTAPFETSVDARPDDTVAPVAMIAVESNPVPVAGVMTVDAGIVTRGAPVEVAGVNTTSEVGLIVTDAALVVVPDIVDTVARVPPVTTTDTEPLVERDPVDSCPGTAPTVLVDPIVEIANVPSTQASKNCFFIRVF